MTLRAVCGRTTAEVASPFIVSEATVAQRIVRPRRGLVQAHVPLRLRTEDELDDRLAGALATLYLLFREGDLAGTDAAPTWRDIAEKPRG